MENCIKDLKDIIENYENNKIRDNDFLENLWDIYEELQKNLTFKPKVLKLIKNYDEYFDSNFNKDTKNYIINIINKEITYHSDKRPQQISIEKNIISDNKNHFDNFLYKLGFTNNYEMDNKIYYIWKF